MQAKPPAAISATPAIANANPRRCERARRSRSTKRASSTVTAEYSDAATETSGRIPWLVATAYSELARTSKNPITSSAASTTPRASGSFGRAYSAAIPSRTTPPTRAAAIVHAGSVSATSAIRRKKTPKPSAASRAGGHRAVERRERRDHRGSPRRGEEELARGEAIVAECQRDAEREHQAHRLAHEKHRESREASRLQSADEVGDPPRDARGEAEGNAEHYPPPASPTGT